MTYDEIYDKIEDVIENNNDVDTLVDELKKIGNLRLEDENIDDGIDDENCADTYVMCRLYTFTSKDCEDSFDIRIYYGNNTMEYDYYRID